ncbi:uncharacterized protein BDR25DRAFT_397384 [Lindgomyces ingoldianus]|uniref:Uncharacterized protein n=1 Tax=Lindgomyces ingoldianus TaxID=673940 RepID=A0ACB6Q7X4_9PLEO|nr:uncharacterized protein BDR25DRAFT_397384 [Lindgomyces ingoldianus]KAF2462956.1 hypothetical protein BDR25DRAFT_397384 [Lindgomyces ingoldianus]
MARQRATRPPYTVQYANPPIGEFERFGVLYEPSGTVGTTTYMAGWHLGGDRKDHDQFGSRLGRYSTEPVASTVSWRILKPSTVIWYNQSIISMGRRWKWNSERLGHFFSPISHNLSGSVACPRLNIILRLWRRTSSSESSDDRGLVTDFIFAIGFWNGRAFPWGKGYESGKPGILARFHLHDGGVEAFHNKLRLDSEYSGKVVIDELFRSTLD